MVVAMRFLTTWAYNIKRNLDYLPPMQVRDLPGFS